MAHRGKSSTDEIRSDAELALEAAKGGTAEFELLYARHAEPAWRVAYAVTGDSAAATDAVSDAFSQVLLTLRDRSLADALVFRSMLLAAVRLSAIDVARHGRRAVAALGAPGPAGATAAAADEPAPPTDREVAFRSLPERSRSVLWLTEVEGVAPAEAAAVLGVTGAGLAALASTSRAALRTELADRYRAADVPTECRFTADRLEEYAAGRLGPADTTLIDRHLAGCAPCRARLEELEDVGVAMRKIAIGSVTPAGAVALAEWTTVASVAVAGGVAGTTTLESLGTVLKPLAAAATTTALVAVGYLLAARPDGRGDGGGAASGPPAVRLEVSAAPAVAGVVPAPAEPAVIDAAAPRLTPSDVPVLSGAPIARRAEPVPEAGPAPAPVEVAPTPTAVAPVPPAEPADTVPPGSGPVVIAPSEPAAQPADRGAGAVATVVVGPSTSTIVVTETCTGVTTGSTTVGDPCDGAEPPAGVVAVVVGVTDDLPVAGKPTVGIGLP